MNSIDYDVLVCTYHGEAYISTQLDSIMKQAILPRKLIISDDSTDRSLIEIVNEIADKYKEYPTEWVIIKGPRRGVVHNFLSALEFSSSSLLFFSDQDDVWCSDKISKFMEEYAKVDMGTPTLIYSDAKVIDEFGNQVFSSFVEAQNINVKVVRDDSILLENCVQGASCCINASLKTIAQDALYFINKEQIVIHDWYFAILAKYFGTIIYLDIPLIAYRQHSSNQVGYVSRFEKIVKVVSSPRVVYKRLTAVLAQRRSIIDYLIYKDVWPTTKKELQFKHIGVHKRLVYKLLNIDV